MTADMITAGEALDLGLVNAVCPPEELMIRCRELAMKISAQAPLAVAGIIRSVNAAADREKDGFREEIHEFGKCFVTDDFREGTRAFLEKRKPVFNGN